MATQPQNGFNSESQTSYLDAEVSSDESIHPAASVPWVAIALAVHAVMLMVAWFIMPPVPPGVTAHVIASSTEQVVDPPPPVQPPERIVEFPDDQPVEKQPTEDKRIQTDDDTHAEDNTNQPNRDLAENPNESPSDNESPHPRKDSSSSATGPGGGIGGGGGPGGKGGYFDKRPGPTGTGVPQHEETENALGWLADHQNREGYWSAARFGDDSIRKDARFTYNVDFVNVGKPGGDTGWEATCDVGLTGLAMLAFTGKGYDHRSAPYARTLRPAVLYLRKVQDNDGCFGSKEDDHFIYNHSICTMAMAELLGISNDRILRPIVERAVQFILNSQNPGLGWRYGVRPGNNDTSVTGWMVLTLHIAEKAGIQFEKEKCFNAAQTWFETVTVDQNGYLKTGYDSPGSDNARLRSASDVYDTNPSMDAIYVMSMLFMNKRDLKDQDIRSLSRVCVEKEYLPQWKHEKIDFYYWYYASLALYQVGGSQWEQWSKAMVRALVDHQRGNHPKDREAGLTNARVLDEYGSWDPVGAWGGAGGRVYATAINCLTLETYYRHARLNDE